MMTTFVDCWRSPCRQTGVVCLVLTIISVFALPGLAQVNSGSDGHDGPFKPTTATVVNMADHPDGVYHYTSVSIPAAASVSGHHLRGRADGCG
jgi:hypothetical protein